MKNRKNWFSQHSITTRIALMFIGLVMIPFFIMAALIVGLFQDYNVSSLGDAARDSMSSVGFQISKELKARKENSMSSYYNDIVEILSKDEIDERDVSTIEKQLTANALSSDGVFAGCVIDKEGNVYGTGSYTTVLSFMEPYQEEVLEAKGRCFWSVTVR